MIDNKAHDFNFCGETLAALPTGALFWPAKGILCVSDLHLGKSERVMRRGGPLLPPYDTQETLSRLDADIQYNKPATVICLGDSFDDLQAAEGLHDDTKLWLQHLQAGRRWIWIEGNHDPGPVRLGGTHLAEIRVGGLTFRHIAIPGASGDVSGHYHPKFSLRSRGRTISRPCFVYDDTRLMLPAYGTFTGGLSVRDANIQSLFGPNARVVMTGNTTHVLPLPKP
jgi:DNA ligase-associated metallophosphoesterase